MEGRVNGVRRQGWQRRRWEDSIKTDLEMSLRETGRRARMRTDWRKLVKAATSGNGFGT